jgi:hypothetical protein
VTDNTVASAECDSKHEIYLIFPSFSPLSE